jgi:hypothetical protein
VAEAKEQGSDTDSISGSWNRNTDNYSTRLRSASAIFRFRGETRVGCRLQVRVRLSGTPSSSAILGLVEFKIFFIKSSE